MSKVRELFFDTTCLIDIYHGRTRIQPYFNEIISGGIRPYLSVITEAELWRGLRTGEVLTHEALVSQFVMMPLRSESARLAGGWMQTYQQTGLGWMDAFIAASSKIAKVPLLTRDNKLASVLKTEAEFEIYE